MTLSVGSQCRCWDGRQASPTAHSPAAAAASFALALAVCAPLPAANIVASCAWQSRLKHILSAGTLVFWMLLPSGPGRQYSVCTQCFLSWWGKPECKTLLRAISHRSVALNFHTYRARGGTQTEEIAMSASEKRAIWIQIYSS